MRGGTSFASFGVYVGTDWQLDCYEYPDDTPILAVSAGRVSFTVSIEGREATGAGVEFARELARQAARFAAEVERLHAEKRAGASGACGGPAVDAA